MKLVGLAGGSGAGKSTVAYALVDAEPDIYEVINLDDYQKLPSAPDLPTINGQINWDHPDIIDWRALITSIKNLQAGKAVTIDVWSHRSNPDYATHRKMIARTIHPKPIIIVEGYLALYCAELNHYYSHKYYLELDDATRQARRGKNDVIADSNYEAQVLIPMHKQYVEPTKVLADNVIDVSNMTAEEVCQILRQDIQQAT